ncbi:MAG: gliding motility lipoprotein GldH [bacterium]|nr:gliding motility lipoprotein GldH [bacterium]
MIKTLQVRNSAGTLLIAVIIFFTSCNRNIVYSQYHSFPGNEWRLKDRAVFDLEISDVQSLNNISLMVRHADTYPYNNLFLFVTTAYPDGKVMTDTMEVILANQKGEWQGSGAGDIYDVKVPIKKNVRFVLPGKYEFTFEQGMRVDPLPMIMDFGLEIEKSK